MSVIDWSRSPQPWRRLGPEIAQVLREVATEGPSIGAATWCLNHGKCLRDQRLSRGMSQADLAEVIGLTRSLQTQVSQWESGNVTPSARARTMLKKLGFIV